MTELPPPPPGLPPGPAGGPPLPPPDVHLSGRRRFRGLMAGIAALLVLILLSAAILVATERPEQGCEPGEFSSQRFGYCLALPDGWMGLAAGKGSRFEVASADLIQAADAPASILISASPIEEGQLDAFVEQVRQRDTEAGAFSQGTTMEGEVAGGPASIFDALAPRGPTPMQIRETLFVRNGFVWRIQLTSVDRTFDADTRELERILETWRFT